MLKWNGVPHGSMSLFSGQQTTLMSFWTPRLGNQSQEDLATVSVGLFFRTPSLCWKSFHVTFLLSQLQNKTQRRKRKRKMNVLRYLRILSLAFESSTRTGSFEFFLT